MYKNVIIKIFFFCKLIKKEKGSILVIIYLDNNVCIIFICMFNLILEDDII